ncbi:MAG: iron complex outermembrane receptor protein [Polaribacter sp.]|jgi:iron complex outermembrane receptor protein
MKYLSSKKAIIGSCISACFCASNVLADQLTSKSELAKTELSSESKKSKRKIIVTGTRIKRIDINSLSPLISISREEIDKQGYANVKDVISNLTQNSGGTIDNSFTFGFTPGASAVNLRGVGFGQTLTLIDGRRLPIYPIGISGTTNFVDLSSIPMAFVERIDVLIDGASAIYGSDAVAGVINIVTRKNIEGISTSYRTSTTSDGGYQTQRFNLLTGARNGNTQLDVIIDYWKQEPLWAKERGYASSDVSNPRGNYSFGGASFISLESDLIIQDPNCGTESGALGGEGIANVNLSVYTNEDTWCGFDRSQYRQLIAPQERLSVMARVSYEVNEDVSFFSRVGVTDSNTKSQTEPNFYGGGLLTGFGSLVPNNGGLVLAGADNNPSTDSEREEAGVFIRRLNEFGPRISDIQNNSINFLAGLNGEFYDGQFDWEIGVAYNNTRLDIEGNNILLSGLNAAVENGLDLFQRIPLNIVEELGFMANKKAESTNKLIDFSLSGDLDFSLKGGPVKFALALEHVKENYFDRPDTFVNSGDTFDGSTSGEGARKHIGIGGELSFPFTGNLEMDIALRWDDYQDKSAVGNAFSPRVAFAYKVTDKVVTRFSWGKSFRAPGMQKLFGGFTSSFTDIVDPDAPTNTGQVGQVVQSVQVFTGSNIELSEEEGINYNLGVAWGITEQLNFTIDVYDIGLEEIVAEPSAQFIVNACSEFDLLCDFIQRDSSGSLHGADAFIVTFPINFAEQQTKGLDLNLDYKWFNSLGDWQATFAATWIQSFYFQAVQGIDKVDNIKLGLFPEYRANIMLDWRDENKGATVKLNYIDKVGGEFCVVCQSGDYIGAWITIDANFRYHYSEFTQLTIGVNNLLNKRPPEDPTQNNWPWYYNAGSYYNSLGRELYLQVNMNF